MIHYKTPQEIELMKKSGAILAEIKQIIWDAIKPGVTTKELDNLAHAEMKKRGVKPNFLNYGGFPGVACISINAEMIHGIPKDSVVIKEGDIVSVDMGCIYKGWHSDSCFTKGVGEISPRAKKVIKVAQDAFWVGVNQIKIGARIGDIESAIGKFVRSKGMYVPDGFTGHGIGTHLHEEPQVHNKGVAGTGPLIKEGMVIAIEPMILQGSDHVFHHDDDWTISSANGKLTAHYEHTVAVIDGKPVLLTGGL